VSPHDLPYLRKDDIALLVPSGVVDLLEMIHVEHNQPHLVAVTL
jgi:hypothetical protein